MKLALIPGLVEVRCSYIINVYTVYYTTALQLQGRTGVLLHAHAV